MQQMTRILTLYKRLIAGKVVNKAQYAAEFETTQRSADRDILAIRIFLSESFSGLDLVYDRRAHGYRLENLQVKQEIGLGECYILSKLLLSSQPLRGNEEKQIVWNLLSQLSSRHRSRAVETLRRSLPPVRQNRLCLQLVEDLLYSIEQRDQILLHFYGDYSNAPCVPYSVEFQGQGSFLLALDQETCSPALYRLEDIHSYRPLRHPYSLSPQEETALQSLLHLLCEGMPEDYEKRIYQKKERGTKDGLSE